MEYDYCIEMYLGGINLNYFYEPVNLKQWNMFEVVKSIGHIEPFLAVSSMNIGDIVFLHVGKQDRTYESGIYAYGRIVKGPYILKDSPQDYCNNKNTVDVEILNISYSKPFVSWKISRNIFNQFRTVHKLDEVTVTKLLDVLDIKI